MDSKTIRHRQRYHNRCINAGKLTNKQFCRCLSFGSILNKLQIFGQVHSYQKVSFTSSRITLSVTIIPASTSSPFRILTGHALTCQCGRIEGSHLIVHQFHPMAPVPPAFISIDFSDFYRFEGFSITRRAFPELLPLLSGRTSKQSSDITLGLIYRLYPETVLRLE